MSENVVKIDHHLNRRLLEYLADRVLCLEEVDFMDGFLEAFWDFITNLIEGDGGICDELLENNHSLSYNSESRQYKVCGATVKQSGIAGTYYHNLYYVMTRRSDNVEYLLFDVQVQRHEVEYHLQCNDRVMPILEELTAGYLHPDNGTNAPLFVQWLIAGLLDCEFDLNWVRAMDYLDKSYCYRELRFVNDITWVTLRYRLPI